MPSIHHYASLFCSLILIELVVFFSVGLVFFPSPGLKGLDDYGNKNYCYMYNAMNEIQYIRGCLPPSATKDTLLRGFMPFDDLHKNAAWQISLHGISFSLLVLCVWIVNKFDLCGEQEEIERYREIIARHDARLLV